MATVAAPKTAAGAKRRYPGVRSFDEPDQAQFRGRKAAAEELLLRVLSVRLLLQFAPSGVGKTSLLAAGLFPRLRGHDYFPFTVRLNLPGESLVQAVRRSLAQAAAEFGLTDPVIPPQADSLWTLLAGTQLWSRDLLLLTPVLVFDQFEEIFTLRDDAFRGEFAQQVGHLASGVPGRSADGETGRESAAPKAKIIISLREEYLGKLQEFSARIPELFRERLRLAPLSADEAAEAIVEPAALVGDGWVSPPFGYTDKALELLIEFIDGASETVKLIEPLTLQLVCHRAETMAIERGAAGGPVMLGVEDFGGLPGLERLVRQHYQEVLGRIQVPAARRRAQRMFEEGLLDPAGKRLMLEQGEIERDYRLDVSTLDSLVASSLLRREPRNESVFYEISHDRLTDTIAKHRKPRLPRWVWPALATTGALVLALLAFAWQQRNLTNEAKAARDQAEYAVNQLLGEKLVSRLREAGLSDALSQILQQTTSGAARNDHAAGLSGVLQWRHAGDIERDRGTLAKARKNYQRALAALDALPAAAPGSALVLLAERARIASALGSIASDAGEVTQAEKYFDEALRHWDAVLKGAQAPRPQEMLDAANSTLDHANLLSRLGDYDRTEAQALAASRMAARVWSAAYDGTHGSAIDANYDTGRAMQVFADAALSLAAPRADTHMGGIAIKLAREAARLRPLSFQARKQLGTAIAVRYMMVPPASAEDWQVLLVEARRNFSELGLSDADSLRMQRERAALEMSIAEIIAICNEDKKACRLGIPAGAIEASRIAAIESTGIFRRLAALDPGSRTLTAEVAWGLSVQSRQLAASGDAQALPRLDEALATVKQTQVDPRDFARHWDRVNNLMSKARLLAKAGQPAVVKAALDEASAELEPLPAQSVGVLFGRIGLLDTAIPLLREARLTKDADALQVRRNGLQVPADGPKELGHANARKLNQQAIELGNALDRSDPAKAQADRIKIEALRADAVNEYPYDAVLWSNLRVARQNVVNGDPEAADPVHEPLLRGAVTAAWMAHVLQPSPAHLERLYEARRSLAIRLHKRGDAGAELLALTERGLAEARQMAQNRPGVGDTLFPLADANLGVGVARESQGAGGWEEAFRVAMLHGERLAAREPANAEHQLWLGENRSYMAGLFDREKRADEATEPRRLALRACQKALSMASATAEQRERAQSCLKGLADVGVK